MSISRRDSVQLWWYRRNKCCKFLPIDGVRILFFHLNCAPWILVFFEQRASNCNISIWTARLKLELHLNQAPWERHLWAKIIELPAFRQFVSIWQLCWVLWVTVNFWEDNNVGISVQVLTCLVKIIFSFLDTGVQSNNSFYHLVYLVYFQINYFEMYNPLE